MSIRKNIALAAAGVIVIAAFAGGAIALHNSVAVHTTHVAVAAPTPDPITTIPADTTVNPEVVDGPVAVAAEQAAAAAQAAQVAADEAAATAAAKAEAAKKEVTPSTNTSGADHPAGTPIPLPLDSDPNSGSYGQMVIEDPALFCSSHAGTTGAGGVQVCA